MKCTRCGKENQDSANLAKDMGLPVSIRPMDRLCADCYQHLTTEHTVTFTQTELESLCSAVRETIDSYLSTAAEYEANDEAEGTWENFRAAAAHLEIILEKLK